MKFLYYVEILFMLVIVMFLSLTLHKSLVPILEDWTLVVSFPFAWIIGKTGAWFYDKISN